MVPIISRCDPGKPIVDGTASLYRTVSALNADTRRFIIRFLRNKPDTSAGFNTSKPERFATHGGSTRRTSITFSGGKS
jgi:hypothetical protein